MQLHLQEISRHVTEGTHAVLLLDRTGWHTTAKLDMPRNITPIFLPSRAPEIEPAGKYLAVHARQLAVKPRLRHLRPRHRRCLRRLAQTHRKARSDHLHRHARLVPHRSDPMTLGFRFRRCRYDPFGDSSANDRYLRLAAIPRLLPAGALRKELERSVRQAINATRGYYRRASRRPSQSGHCGHL
jgi:hypothetical protein